LRPTFVVPLSEERDYAQHFQQPQQQFVQQIALNCQTNPSLQQNPFGQQNNERLVYETAVTDLSSLMFNFLPEMHNPSTEVTQIINNQLNDKQMKDEIEVTKMSNTSVETNEVSDFGWT